MKGYNKKGQFFILAAVIISAVVISLGVISNQALTNKDPNRFEDFTYEVKKETGSVIDSEIYTGLSTGADLDKFVQLLARDIRDRDTGANFMFIYGNNTALTVRNYGSENAYVGGEEVSGEGANVLSKICYGGSCYTVDEFIGEFRSSVTYLNESQLTEGFVDVPFSGGNYRVNLTRNQKVVFLIQKRLEGENYVSVR